MTMYAVVRYDEDGDVHCVVDGGVYKEYEEAAVAYGELLNEYSGKGVAVGTGFWFSICEIQVDPFITSPPLYHNAMP